jgi:hypothetical protein
MENIMENPPSSLRSPQQERDDRAQRRRESNTFCVEGTEDANLPTPRRCLPFATPEVAAAAILNSLSVKKQKVVAADVMGDIADEDRGMSSGSEDVEVTEVLQKGNANASETHVALIEMNTEIDKEREEMKQKHEAAAALLVTPADLVTARHKEVWFLGLSWEHAKRRALNLAPLYI